MEDESTTSLLGLMPSCLSCLATQVQTVDKSPHFTWELLGGSGLSNVVGPLAPLEEKGQEKKKQSDTNSWKGCSLKFKKTLGALILFICEIKIRDLARGEKLCLSNSFSYIPLNCSVYLNSILI